MHVSEQNEGNFPCIITLGFDYSVVVHVHVGHMIGKNDCFGLNLTPVFWFTESFLDEFMDSRPSVEPVPASSTQAVKYNKDPVPEFAYNQSQSITVSPASFLYYSVDIWSPSFFHNHWLPAGGRGELEWGWSFGIRALPCSTLLGIRDACGNQESCFVYRCKVHS